MVTVQAQSDSTRCAIISIQNNTVRLCSVGKGGRGGAPRGNLCPTSSLLLLSPPSSLFSPSSLFHLFSSHPPLSLFPPPLLLSLSSSPPPPPLLLLPPPHLLSPSPLPLFSPPIFPPCAPCYCQAVSPTYLLCPSLLLYLSPPLLCSSSSHPGLFLSSPFFISPPPPTFLPSFLPPFLPPFLCQCPANDLLENARSKGVYQTMTTDGFLTIKVQVRELGGERKKEGMREGGRGGRKETREGSCSEEGGQVREPGEQLCGGHF